MSERTGLPGAEVSALQAVAALVTDDATVPTPEVLARLDSSIGPSAGYRMLIDLVAGWQRHLPLLRGEGNWGGLDDQAADADHTEVGLTATGWLAVAAEAAELGPVPLGLVDGSWYRGGRCPPYAPGAVLAALEARDPSELVPASPTGGTISGDLLGLHAGRAVELVLAGTTVLESFPGRPSPANVVPSGAEGGWFTYGGVAGETGATDGVVVTELPYGVGPDQAVLQLEGRSRREDGQTSVRRYLAPSQQHLTVPLAPIVSVTDVTSARTGLRIECRLRDGVDPVQAQTWVQGTWPVTRTKRAQLPGALAELITGWDVGDASGLDALKRILAGDG